MTAAAIRSLRRYRRVMVAVEFWLWPMTFAIDCGEVDFDGSIRYASIHIGPLVLAVQWCFAEDVGA